MDRTRGFFIYWLPVAVWMTLIFSASGDAASYQHSSHMFGPLMRWLFPRITNEEASLFMTVIRKGAHLTEYAVLALLVWRARRLPLRHVDRPWNWATAGEAVWVCVAYAATDEFHQTFIASREGCLRDVLIDTSGAVAGLIALWLIGRWLKYW
jgi:VanZ family protein